MAHQSTAFVASQQQQQHIHPTASKACATFAVPQVVSACLYHFDSVGWE
jgi:hypothetical protein